MSISSLFPWTCRKCLIGASSRATQSSHHSIRLPPQFQSRLYSSHGPKISKPSRRYRVLLGGATGALVLGTVVTVSEDGKHYIGAAERTIRVLKTLAICINDYRATLNQEDDTEAYASLLKACHIRCAQRTLKAMEKNGSIFIKLGQHLSSLNYLLPTEWCETFIPLQDRCPVSSFESIQAMVLQDTGRPLEEYFSSFEEQPIGAASLAQVHRAVDKLSGEQVAVKLQHPNLDEWAPLDLALTRFTFSTLKRWFPEYDLTWLSEEMEVSLPQELDFNREAANAIRARMYFSHVRDAPLIIPRVLWAQRRILVMEYVTGKRPDDLKYLDENHIDRDEVSAALARIFNEMIFGTDAPLHCDPHAGNIAIRHNSNRWGKANFDVILYDHGLYRDLPLSLRRSYAKLWLAVLDVDVERMRKYSKEVAGIENQDFELFASAITGRDFSVFQDKESGGVNKPRNQEEKKAIGDALGEGLLAQLVQLLGKVPKVLLLVLKTNDLTRSLDDGLQTREGPARSYLILGRYAARTVYIEQLERIGGSLFWPPNWLAFMRAWLAYRRLELRLSVYETLLRVRRMIGMKPIGVELGVAVS